MIGSLKMQVPFAKAPYKRDLYSAEETYLFEEPTDRCHPISLVHHLRIFHPMEWRRFVGSFKILVSFAMGTTKETYILQKKPIFLGSLQMVATPYHGNKYFR